MDAHPSSRTKHGGGGVPGSRRVPRLVPVNGEVVWVCKWLERVRDVVLYLDDMGKNLERAGFSAFIAEAMARRSGVSVRCAMRREREQRQSGGGSVRARVRAATRQHGVRQRSGVA